MKYLAVVYIYDNIPRIVTEDKNNNLIDYRMSSKAFGKLKRCPTNWPVIIPTLSKRDNRYIIDFKYPRQQTLKNLIMLVATLLLILIKSFIGYGK